MDEHPIQGLMTTAMENLKDMIEVNTIIGDPVESPDGSVIIPVSKVGFGFAAGGSEFNGGSSKGGGESGGSEKLPFGGGSGGGVSITPVAFLIVSPKGIKMIHMDENTHIYDKMIDFAPKAVEKIQQMLKESGQTKKPEQKKSEEQSKKQDDKQQQDKSSSQQSEDQTNYDI